jgi:endonuclease/exonuclease/phosphatase family metal-dependent hydrolase
MFRVATLNIWNYFGPWDQRAPVLLDALMDLQPDVIGLQEVVSGENVLDQFEWLCDKTGWNGAWGLAQNSVGNAILSKHRVEAREVVTLPQGGTDEVRSVTCARIVAPHAVVPFFVTHLNWRLDQGHVRREQVRALVEVVRRLSAGTAHPPVVTGDFNADPDSDEIRYMKGLTGLGGPCTYFVDAFAAAGHGPGDSAGYTYAKRNHFTRPYHEPNRRIDYVFVGQPTDDGTGEVMTARVCFDVAGAQGAFPSDHFGVAAELFVSESR